MRPPPAPSTPVYAQVRERVRGAIQWHLVRDDVVLPTRDRKS